MILSEEEPVEGLLLVGAYREGDLDAAHPLAPMLARWRRQPVGPHYTRLGNLPPDGPVWQPFSSETTSETTSAPGG